MRKKVVAGNWKMNKNLKETQEFLKALTQELHTPIAHEVIVAPTFVNLALASELLKDSFVDVAAQNMHHAQSGAFTGEVSADMLKDAGVRNVILGHSERRAYFGEDEDMLKVKVDAALEQEMRIIFCFGEQLQERKNNNHFGVVEHQVSKALFHLEPASWQHIVLAYEPVWAIGTGETATPEQAQEMHAFIRELLQKKYGETLANRITILYGGSVKPANAKEIFDQPDVDGGLIGGASLQASSFAEIVRAL